MLPHHARQTTALTTLIPYIIIQKNLDANLFPVVAHWYSTFNTIIDDDGLVYGGGIASPDQINFLIFTSVWTLLVTVYLALSPVYMPHLAHKYAILALDAVTMIFWFAGFIALAVFITELSLCFGNVCHSAQAAVVFGAFTWYVSLFLPL